MSDVQQMKRMIEDLRQTVKRNEEEHRAKAEAMERAHKAEIADLKAKLHSRATAAGTAAVSAEDPNEDLLMAGVWFFLEYLKKSNALPEATGGGPFLSGAPVAERYLGRASTTASPRSLPKAPPVVPTEKPDKLETTLNNAEADALRKAAAKYDKEYQAKMQTMVVPKEEEKALPFIGFSLADNIKEGVLVVDGVFDAGPASQVGIDIDHELVAVEGEKAATFDGVRALIKKHCKPGHISNITMRDQNHKPYEAQLWVMTAEERFQGKPYFFDATKHQIRQSDRVKTTYRTRGSPFK